MSPSFYCPYSLCTPINPEHFSPPSLAQGLDDLLGGDGDGEEEEEEEEGSVAQSFRSPVGLKGRLPYPDRLNTDDTLMLFAGNSCSRTGSVCVCGGRGVPMGYVMCKLHCCE